MLFSMISCKCSSHPMLSQLSSTSAARHVADNDSYSSSEESTSSLPAPQRNPRRGGHGTRGASGTQSDLQTTLQQGACLFNCAIQLEYDYQAFYIKFCNAFGFNCLK